MNNATLASDFPQEHNVTHKVSLPGVPSSACEPSAIGRHVPVPAAFDSELVEPGRRTVPQAHSAAGTEWPSMGSSLSTVLGHVCMDPRGADSFVVIAVPLSPRQMGQLGCFLPTCRPFWDSQAHTHQQKHWLCPHTFVNIYTLCLSYFCQTISFLFQTRHASFFVASWGSLSVEGPCVLGPSVSFSGACAASHMLSL